MERRKRARSRANGEGGISERKDGRFCINSVTGPDEYTTVVDNNAYTNLMAKENLEVATRVVEWLQGADREAHEALVAATGLRESEVDGWRRAAEACLPARNGRVACDSGVSGNFTQIDSSVRSSYSTSASASAVWSETHQCTGFNPLYTPPRAKKRPSSRMIVAS